MDAHDHDDAANDYDGHVVAPEELPAVDEAGRKLLYFFF